MTFIIPQVDGSPGECFSWSEMTTTSTGLANTPNATEKINLKILCSVALDPLRRHLGLPVRITSGFRSEAVNKAVGGSKTSAHRKGLAEDIKVRGLDAHALMQAVIVSDIPFDQAIAYHPSRGGHLHLGLSEGTNRKQMLWARKSGGYERYDSSS